MLTFAEKQKEQTDSHMQPYTLQRKPTQEQAGGFTDQRSNSEYQRRENNTGLSDQLKSGVESLSGLDMSDVRVHRNSSKPTTVNALAYTQGSNIHMAPGQEKHIAHEAWHAVQQKQGRVQPTMQMAGAKINDNAGLENEADSMGNKALQLEKGTDLNLTINNDNDSNNIIQLVGKEDMEETIKALKLLHKFKYAKINNETFWNEFTDVLNKNNFTDEMIETLSTKEAAEKYHKVTTPVRPKSKLATTRPRPVEKKKTEETRIVEAQEEIFKVPIKNRGTMEAKCNPLEMGASITIKWTPPSTDKPEVPEINKMENDRIGFLQIVTNSQFHKEYAKLRKDEYAKRFYRDKDRSIESPTIDRTDSSWSSPQTSPYFGTGIENMKLFGDEAKITLGTWGVEASMTDEPRILKDLEEGTKWDVSFETIAMVVEGDNTGLVVGRINWDLKVVPTADKGEINYSVEEVYATPSAEFMRAVNVWNQIHYKGEFVEESANTMKKLIPEIKGQIKKETKGGACA